MSSFSMEKYTVSQMDAGDHDTYLISEHGGFFNVQLFDDDAAIASELTRRLNQLEELKDENARLRHELGASILRRAMDSCEASVHSDVLLRHYYSDGYAFLGLHLGTYFERDN